MSAPPAAATSPTRLVTRERVHYAFLNAGHFLTHLFMLVFATVAALALTRAWGLTYAELIPYATPGFIAFGVCALPAGWLADRWSREGMLVVFFIGIGLASMATALANSPLQIGAALLAVGVFAAIYHPVGIALVVEGREKTGLPLAVNGVFGNLGVACAALVTGYLIDAGSWRTAFVVPGLVSIAVGLAYAWLVRDRLRPHDRDITTRPMTATPLARRQIIRVIAIIFVSTAIGGIIFQSTTFALPKVLDERLASMAISASTVGWYTFVVFALAAVAQLIVGYLIDATSVRTVFVGVAALQAAFFALMPGREGPAALVVAGVFMLAVFGQIPINDVLIGRVTTSRWRARIFGVRFVVTFSGVALGIPLVAYVQGTWGFDMLFEVLAAGAIAILAAVALLPAVIPAPKPTDAI